MSGTILRDGYKYIPNGSLEDLLQKKGKLLEIDAIELTIGVLEGLQHLHENGIIHRDLKPANILLKGETPMLSDFGISRIISGVSLSETIVGTLAYMAPECFDGKRNIQTDVWAVGIILYRILSGNLPFPQKETAHLISSITQYEFEILPQYISHETKQIVNKSLAKKPENRYKNSREMITEMHSLVGNHVQKELSSVQQAFPNQNVEINKPISITIDVNSDRSKEYLSYERVNHRSKIIAAICFVLAVFLSISIFTHSPTDWSLTNDSSFKTKNWFGIIGAITSDLLFQMFGLIAYFFPAFLILLSIQILRKRKLSLKLSQLLGYILLFTLISSLLNLTGFYGGILGSLVLRSLSQLFGNIGLGILFATIYIVALLLITDTSIESIFKRNNKKSNS